MEKKETFFPDHVITIHFCRLFGIGIGIGIARTTSSPLIVMIDEFSLFALFQMEDGRWRMEMDALTSRYPFSSLAAADTTVSIWQRS